MNNFYINKRINPKGLKKDEYDVIIIGAGIGGLVCGCYLAKAGMKVLIVEKNDKPGGYCTSFERDGYRFDVGPHYLGSLRKGGLLHNIFTELGLKSEFLRMKRLDTIIMSDMKIDFGRDIEETIKNFQQKFPGESRKIEEFFTMVTSGSFGERYSFIKKKKYLSFMSLLNDYFSNEKLKDILSIPLINLGLPARYISCLSAVTLYREFVLDGGYYFVGGMQTFSNVLSERFRKWGGDFIFKHMVNKIVVLHSKAKGVILDNNDYIASRQCIVSNADVKRTFTKLIGSHQIPEEFIVKVKSLTPSTSMFIVWLGVGVRLNSSFIKAPVLWYIPSYKQARSKHYFDITYDDDVSKGPLFCTIPSFYDKTFAPSKNKECLKLMVGASFRSKLYWDKNKNRLAEIVIKRLEELVPYISKHIETKVVATPQTLYEYTLNSKGAILGWSAIPTQYSINYKTPISNLFLSSQWVSFLGVQGGISMVSLVGRNVSRTILNGARYKNIKVHYDNFSR